MQLAGWIDIEGRLPLLITAGALVLVFGVLGIVAFNHEPLEVEEQTTTEQAATELASLALDEEPEVFGDCESLQSIGDVAVQESPHVEEQIALLDGSGGRRGYMQRILATHEVAPGDTLYGISRKHYGTGRYWRALAVANQLGSGTVELRIGQQLGIPDLGTLHSSNDPSERSSEGPATVVIIDEEDSASSVPSATGRIYTVQAGDTLWSISERQLGAGAEWQKIMKANPGVDSRHPLRVGQDLCVPE